MGNFTKAFERTARLKAVGLHGTMGYAELLKYINGNVPFEERELHKAMAEKELKGKPKGAVYAYFQLMYGKEAKNAL